MSTDSLSLIVNGVRHEIDADDVDQGQSLTDVLRNRLNLKGTKSGCCTGDCGSCTVLADGLPILSCRTPAVTAGGLQITTIEGLSKLPDLHPLQLAFMDHGVTGCGLCIPGMLLSAASLLAADPRPTRDDVMLALAGHICHCFGHSSFIDAVMTAAHQPDRISVLVSQDDDACQRVTGRARLVADMMLPNLAEAAVLASHHDRARIISIDTSRAEALKGVIKVVTAADLAAPRVAALRPSLDTAALAETVVRFRSESVAAVVAETAELARLACELIQVEYELESVISPQVASEISPAHVNADQASGDFIFDVNSAVVSAPEDVIADWKNDSLEILTDATPTSADRSALFGVSLQGLSEARTGWQGIAAFPCQRRERCAPLVPLAIILARIVQRPVRLRANETGLQLRPSQQITTKISSSVGSIASIDVTARIDVGADPLVLPLPSIRTGDLLAAGIVKATIEAAFSNGPPVSLVDGNLIEMSFALQQTIDAAARSSNVDPVLFRLRQSSCQTVREAIKNGAERFGWSTRWNGWMTDRSGRRQLGTGMALVGEQSADGNATTIAAFVEAEIDREIGTVSLGNCLLSVAGSGLDPQQTRLAVQRGFGDGIAAALIDEIAFDLSAKSTRVFRSRPLTSLDLPMLELVMSDERPAGLRSFAELASCAAAATVGAIANAVGHTMRRPVRSLPLSFERQVDTDQTATPG